MAKSFPEPGWMMRPLDAPEWSEEAKRKFREQFAKAIQDGRLLEIMKDSFWSKHPWPEHHGGEEDDNV